jgi:5-methylcytosine-specific restriction endonuclease McrA
MRYDGELHAEHSECVRRGLRVPATVTDHIVSQNDGGAHMDPANSQSLCLGCNSRKAVRLEGGFGPRDR